MNGRRLFREYAQSKGKEAKEFVDFMKKFIEGRLQTRSWEDKDGVKKYATEIVAHNVQYVGGKPEGDKRDAGSAAAPSLDDIPF